MTHTHTKKCAEQRSCKNTLFMLTRDLQSCRKCQKKKKKRFALISINKWRLSIIRLVRKQYWESIPLQTEYFDVCLSQHEKKKNEKRDDRNLNVGVILLENNSCKGQAQGKGMCLRISSILFLEAFNYLLAIFQIRLFSSPFVTTDKCKSVLNFSEMAHKFILCTCSCLLKGMNWAQLSMHMI